MLDGFGYVFGQVTLLLVVAVLLGALLGHYAWPRRATRQEGPPVAAVPAVSAGSAPVGAAAEGTPSGGFFRPASGLPAAGPTPGFRPGGGLPSGPTSLPGIVPPGTPPPTGAVPATGPLPVGPTAGGDPEAAALVADAQARAAYTQARLEQAQARVGELETRLAEAQATQKETRRQLGQADAELVRMGLQVRELQDRTEAEMGRLESGAIAALESTIATHRDQVAKLEEKLATARAAAEEHVQELELERRRSTQLQSALAERDQHLATLMAEREPQERAAGSDSGVTR